MATWGMSIACWITQPTNTLNICTIYCFSTATMVVGTRLEVKLYVHCVYCLQYDLCNEDLGQYDSVHPHVSFPQLFYVFSVKGC
jgi:hypothetical protein